MPTKDGATPRTEQLTEHLPRDGKDKPISIGDRVWYYGCGQNLNPSVHGYNPMALVCEMPVSAVGADFIFAGESLIPIPSKHVYTDIRDAFAVMRGALTKDRFDPNNKHKPFDRRA